MRCALVLALALTAPPARGCELALMLAVDVSGSVDAHDYRLQAEGIAAALRDPEVAAAMLRARAAVAVLQWSGAGQQSLSIPWTRIEEPAALRRLAARAGLMPRAFAGGNTAVGQALDAAGARFGPEVGDCARWVIDISGDGDENEGFTVGHARRAALRRGITVNALAIEDAGTGLPVTNFFRAWVITPGGFAETARGHADVARALRRKLLRELAPPLADALRLRLWRAAAARGPDPGADPGADLALPGADGLFFGRETPMLAAEDRGR